MWLYILNILTIPIYALLIKDKKKFVILVSIQLFLVLALREITVGVDLGNYSEGYNYISRLDFDGLLSGLKPSGVSALTWQFEYENGYTILNWMFSHLGIGFHGFLVFCAAVNVSTISYFIYRYSKKPWLSFVIFCTFGFYMSTFGIIRHSLALSMCLLAYCFFEKKKYLFGILAFLLAFSFHRTALLALPVLALLVFPIKNITRKKFLYLLLLAVAVFVVSGPLYNNVIVNIMTAMEKVYVGNGIELNKKIFLFILFAIFMLFAYDFSKIKTKVENVSCYALVFTIYFTIIGFHNAALTRALPFYSIFLIILIPDLFAQYRAQKSVLMVEMAVVVLLVVYAYFVMRGSAIDPYIIYQGVLSC